MTTASNKIIWISNGHYILMKNIQLIYFKGCPNYEPAKSLLLQSGYDFEEIDQGELSDNHPLKHYTSPTILKNETLIISEKMSSSIGGCSTQLPNFNVFKRFMER